VPPCEHKNEKIRLMPLKTGVSGGATTFLKVEKPYFLFLEGSTGLVVAAVVATAALPDTSAARARASVECVVPSTDCPAAGASALAPGACSSTASAALDDGGAGSHLSGGARPPSLSSSSSDDGEYSEAAGRESPCCSRSRYSLSHCSRRSRRQILRSFLCAARSCSRRCAACARSRSRRGQVVPRGVHGHPLLEIEKCQNHFGTS
jgi:hypothetical protein